MFLIYPQEGAESRPNTMTGKKYHTRVFKKYFPPALKPGYLESEKKHNFIISKYDQGNNLTNIQYSIRGSYHCQMNFNF